MPALRDSEPGVTFDCLMLVVNDQYVCTRIGPPGSGGYLSTTGCCDGDIEYDSSTASYVCCELPSLPLGDTFPEVTSPETPMPDTVHWRSAASHNMCYCAAAVAGLLATSGAEWHALTRDRSVQHASVLRWTVLQRGHQRVHRQRRHWRSEVLCVIGPRCSAHC